ncbi:MAG: peptidoglycan DD-metalloendopeptidase family protein [Anaerolineales bacterium]
MKNRQVIKFSIYIICLFFITGQVSAQEEIPPLPQYVVQSGDTLSKIASRFGISENELINENNILNPNLLYAGAVITLPGVNWIEGVIDAYNVPVGETFRTISRRFNFDTNTLVRLGSLASPSQLFAGYPLLLVTGRGEDFSVGRAAVGPATSIFEIAVGSGINPWTIVAGNKLPDSSAAIQGDVLLLPGTDDPGPGALPSPLKIEIRGGDFIQGKTVIIAVGAGGEQVQLSGEYLDHKLNFFTTGEGEYVALQGIHAMMTLGVYPLKIQGIMPDGSSFEYSQMVAVKSGEYGSEPLHVDPSYLDPVANETESTYLDMATTYISPEKIWDGAFQIPVKYGSQIKSVFGTRRSFNGSPYDYFHSGVDFGWDAGVDILAPAKGVVVSVGFLEIRGNVTIIDHGWGIFTLYAHQADIFVEVGDIVEPGQLIGHIGSTGRSSGPHLHWEVWAGGVQVEPLDWIYHTYP